MFGKTGLGRLSCQMKVNLTSWSDCTQSLYPAWVVLFHVSSRYHLGSQTALDKSKEAFQRWQCCHRTGSWQFSTCYYSNILSWKRDLGDIKDVHAPSLLLNLLARAGERQHWVPHLSGPFWEHCPAPQQIYNESFIFNRLCKLRTSDQWRSITATI